MKKPGNLERNPEDLIRQGGKTCGTSAQRINGILDKRSRSEMVVPHKSTAGVKLQYTTEIIHQAFITFYHNQ